MVSRLYRASEYSIERTERGIVFLDFMDNVGSAALDDGEDEAEVRREITREIIGEFSKRWDFNGKNVFLMR